MPRKSRKRPANKDDRLFIANVHGGWSQKAGKYVDAKGRFATRDKALSDGQPEKVPYGSAPAIISPTSRAFEVIEVSLWDRENNIVPELPKELQNYKAPNLMLQAARAVLENERVEIPKPNLMPSAMRARMMLSENFWNTDGDAANVIDAPIDLLYKTPFVENASNELRSEVEDLMRKWNFDAILPELWRAVRLFGDAIPYEIWDNKIIQQVVPLPPLYVHIGYNSSYTLSANMVGEDSWSTRVLRTTMHPAMYRNIWWHWNYNAAVTDGLNFNESDGEPLTELTTDAGALARGVAYLQANNVNPIYDKKFTWYRYAMPMLSKGFRDLTDLYVYEDTVRALVEGTKYQMWIFTLGDADHPPKPEEVTALINTIGGVAGERTGTIVWKQPFKGEVLGPEGLDRLIGNDYYSIKKKAFFRKMGITPMVISGEKPGTLGASGGTGGGSGQGDLDVRLFLERQRFQANQVLAWAKYLIVKQLREQNKGGVRDAEKLTLRLPYADVEIESKFKNVFGEAYRDGLISEENALRSMNLHYDDVVQAKKNAQKDRDAGLFNPPTTFVQQTVNPGTEPTTTGQTEPQGSPTKAGEQRNDVGMTPDKTVE